MKKKNLILIGMISFIGIGLIFTRCSKEEKIIETDAPQQEQLMVQSVPNPAPGEIEIPAATAVLKTYESRPYFKDDPVSSLEPATFAATLAAGESAGETKTGYIMGAPPLGDIMFCLDLTGSMGGELNNAKTNSVNIMNAVDAVIANTHFGVMSHMDYPGYFSGCGYSDYYGSEYYGDYPYLLNQSMTDDKSFVQSAINDLVLGFGEDGPENYSRPFYESYSDMTIGWRTGAKKILIAWLDFIPHDCDVFEIINSEINQSTGPDPGRDGVVGTGDDLAILEVLQGMADNNITLIVLNSGGNNALWQAFAAITGGTSVQINPDGTIPGGIDIADFIADLILEEVSSIDNITLEVCTPGYESWLTYIEPFDPSFYVFDPEYPAPWTDEADIVITVPEGTDDGEYFFDICLIGDGAEYGRQNVTITVQSVIEVPFDVHPTSCPNPINRTGKGKIPMAILGTEDFDVTLIDVNTIQIMGVSPLMWALEDVATPYYPFIGKEPDKMSCNTYESDGYTDLTLKFSNMEIAALLAGYERGDVVVLTITGMLLDGTDFIGEDIIWIVDKQTISASAAP